MNVERCGKKMKVEILSILFVWMRLTLILLIHPYYVDQTFHLALIKSQLSLRNLTCSCRQSRQVHFASTLKHFSWLFISLARISTFYLYHLLFLSSYVVLTTRVALSAKRRTQVRFFTTCPWASRCDCLAHDCPSTIILPANSYFTIWHRTWVFFLLIIIRRLFILMLHLYIHIHIIYIHFFTLQHISLALAKRIYELAGYKIIGTFICVYIFFSYRGVCVVLTINIAFIFISAKAIQARSLIVHDNITRVSTMISHGLQRDTTIECHAATVTLDSSSILLNLYASTITPERGHTIPPFFYRLLLITTPTPHI